MGAELTHLRPRPMLHPRSARFCGYKWVDTHKIAESCDLLIGSPGLLGRIIIIIGRFTQSR
jgi:hypothetical protein